MGAIFDDALKGSFKVSVVAAGLDGPRDTVPRSMNPELSDTRGFDESEPAVSQQVYGVAIRDPLPIRSRSVLTALAD